MDHKKALGVLVLVASLVPTWTRLELADRLWLDCRVAATILGLCAYCLHPRANYPVRLGYLDAVMLSLLAIHFASDLEQGRGILEITLRAYGEWCVPYFAGDWPYKLRKTSDSWLPGEMAVGLLQR